MLTAMGSVPLGTLGGGTAGLRLGEAMRDLGGNSRARLLQDAQQEVTRQGLTPGTQGFTKAAVAALTRRGLVQEAVEAQQLGTQLEGQSLQVEKMRTELRGDPGGAQRRFEGLVLAGVDQEVAARMAPNKKLFESVMGNLFKKQNVPAQIQAYQFAVGQGFQGSFLDYQTQLKRAGASSVTVNVDKPLGVSDLKQLRTPQGAPLPPGTTMRQAAEMGATVVSAEEQAAVTDIAKLEAAQGVERDEVVSAIAQMRDANLGIGGVGEAFDSAKQYELIVGRLAKAVAQMRNPGSAEASAQAEERIVEQFPSFAVAKLRPQTLDRVLDTLSDEVQSPATTPQPGRRRRFNRATGRLE